MNLKIIFIETDLNKHILLLFKINHNILGAKKNDFDEIDGFLTFLDDFQNKEFFIFTSNFYNGMKNKYDFYVFLKNCNRGKESLKMKNLALNNELIKNFTDFKSAALNTTVLKDRIVLYIKNNFSLFLINDFEMKHDHFEIVFSKINTHLDYKNNKKELNLLFFISKELYDTKITGVLKKILDNRKKYIFFSVKKFVFSHQKIVDSEIV